MSFGDQTDTRKKFTTSTIVWNVITLIVILACIALIGLFIIIFINPYFPLNPFPPQQMPQLISLPTSTPTAEGNVLPATWTPTVTSLPTSTFTPAPPTATATIFSIPLTPTPTLPEGTTTPGPSPTPSVFASMPFVVRETPVYLTSTIVHPEAGCNWLGVGGQVFDLQGSPVVGYTIQLGGTLDGNPIDMLSLTGTALQYGQAGYEFTMANKPVASNDTVWLQMLDQAGLPLSERITFDTFDDCQKNLVLINFKQVR
jgi:hypothetical protein